MPFAAQSRDEPVPFGGVGGGLQLLREAENEHRVIAVPVAFEDGDAYTGAVLVASGGGMGEAQLAMMIGNMVNMKYGREDELQSDELGVRFMSEAGYDPRALIGVMKILNEASGGQAPPEFMSTHPSTPNRVATIQTAIDALFPDGVPPGLEP